MAYDLQDFERDVLQRSHQVPVLVDFWAPWCGPCRTLGPVLDRLAAAAQDRWVLVKLNTEENPDLAKAFDIRSIPAVKLFRNGEVADQFLGALPEREIREWLEKNLPSPHTATVTDARNLLAAGRQAEAANLLESVLAAEPGNAPARLALAEAWLATAPARVESLLAHLGADSDLAERATALRRLAGLADLAEHPERLPEAAVRDRFLAGARAVRSGDFAAALEAFIEVIERGRHYQDGAARDACKAIFQHLGIRHPIAERFHRAFSSAVNS